MCLIELADFEKQSPRPVVFQFGANPTADSFKKTFVNFLQRFVCGRSRARYRRKKSGYGNSRERNVGAKEIEVLDGGGKLEKGMIMMIFKQMKEMIITHLPHVFQSRFMSCVAATIELASDISP